MAPFVLLNWTYAILKGLEMEQIGFCCSENEFISDASARCLDE